MTVPGPAMPRPGSIASDGTASPYAVHSRSTMRAQRPPHLDDVGRVVGTGVGDAEAAAEVELGQLDPVLVAHRDEQPDHPVRRDLEAAGVEDLRADVGVQADQLEPRRGEHPAYRLEGVAAGQREAELLVLVRGRDELVGVRLDADGARTSTRWVAPRSTHSRPSRSISSSESTTTRPTPASRAAASSATDLLLPCSSIRSPGNPARTATASSPPVHTSRPSPSSSTQRATAVQRNALAA